MSPKGRKEAFEAVKRHLMKHGVACFKTQCNDPGTSLPGSSACPGASLPGSSTSSGESLPGKDAPQQIAAPCCFETLPASATLLLSRHSHHPHGVCPGGPELRPGKIAMEVAGATCVAFSPLGKREGLAHNSMRDFHVWGASSRLMEPTIILFECALHFSQGGAGVLVQRQVPHRDDGEGRPKLARMAGDA